MSKRVSTPSQMDFAHTVHADIPRSVFRRPSGLKTTFNCGKLVPIYLDEVLPGDTFDLSLDSLSRMSTPIFPTMDDIKLEFYAMHIPFRLLWDHWEELCGENKTGAWVPAEEPALVPVYEQAASDATTTVSKKLGDYLGLPVGVDLSKYPVSALPFRATALVWNEWFRDENLQAPIPINKGNTITSADYGYGPNSDLLPVNKFHDYFTSALPAPQKGDSPFIPIELNQLIPVITSNHASSNVGSTSSLRFAPATALTEPASTAYQAVLQRGATGDNYFLRKTDITVSGDDVVDPENPFIPNNLWADARHLTQLNSTTIAELRTAFQIQKLYEKDARGGKLLCLHVKKIAEKIWKALFELIRGEGFCQPQRIVSEII